MAMNRTLTRCGSLNQQVASRDVRWRNFGFFALCCVFPSRGERELEAVHLGYLAWGISLDYTIFRVIQDIKSCGERNVAVHVKSVLLRKQDALAV